MVELISKVYQKRQFQRIINRLWEGSKDIALFFRNLPEDIDIGGFKFKVREVTDMPVHWKSYGERLMDLISSEAPEPAFNTGRIRSNDRQHCEKRSGRG